MNDQLYGVSIIVPCIELSGDTDLLASKISSYGWDGYEVLILPDKPCLKGGHEIFPFTRIVETGPKSPGEKRDIAARLAQYEILSFIDDDAYPSREWIRELRKAFSIKSIVMVGGPAIDTPESSFQQRISGSFYLTYLGGGSPERYYPIGIGKTISDWPTVNLSVKKEVFLDVNGFQFTFWPGEDTLLCRKVFDLYPEGMIYAKNMIVFHKRRSSLFKHFRQLRGYGEHRGYFFRMYPENSRFIKYTLPSVYLLVFLATLSLIPISPWIFVIGFAAPTAAVSLLAGVDSFRRSKDVTATLGMSTLLPLMHMMYGLSFLKGLIYGPKIRKGR